MSEAETSLSHASWVSLALACLLCTSGCGGGAESGESDAGSSPDDAVVQRDAPVADDAKGDDTGPECRTRNDCESRVCREGRCASPTCTDNVQNGSETDTDCGGDCDPCEIDEGCTSGSDCVSGVCGRDDDGDKVCLAPSCDDGVENGEEFGPDCGGPCEAGCDGGTSCEEDSDCESRSCIEGTCSQASCQDGSENGSETDVDCGGPNCPGCEPSETCNKDRDCASGRCTDGTCAQPACDDGIENGDETDVDCGGPECDPCDKGDDCNKPRDCKSTVCRQGTCRVRPCRDGKQNNQETDVDCGGPTCGACDVGKSCNKDRDCQSGMCIGGICGNCQTVGETRTTDCGYSKRGTVTQKCNQNHVWTDQGQCKGVWYASCKQILADNPNASSGTYTIDPDGPGRSEFESFSVQCDMSYKGGGWTVVTPCIAKNKLNGTMQAIESGTRSGFDNQCRPFTEDGNGDHAYVFDFEFPPGYREFHLADYRARAKAQPGDTTEVRPQNAYDSWRNNASHPNDIAFGNPSFPRPTTQYSDFLTDIRECQSCSDKFKWPPGKRVFRLTRTSYLFRIAWSEGGPQDEGWYPWWQGTIRLR